MDRTDATMIHVTTTCADIGQARQIARALLQPRLAACVTITPGVLSLFHWQGRIEEDSEVTLVAKTLPAHRAAVVAAIGQAHPYDLPVITWETVGTTPEAQAWCAAETGGVQASD
ncbi:Periplasmic divalent cation tolerance protein CutA [Roseibacterium elongatum DSM 19469]|uniref:Periplasmic divalent cation tolerance protein CutA n=1 Tax=Roseicyclus elongatus DSM 19469 TaxID=1294273 RepID=W8RST9_9RHOB|nr:divalent-cation tolerance protein CutA [Roseibacterium elongatum]AHM04269.1 Periplasmic divalent cation tolerance protein CutA [Roseibacterium elongatum DSM 19469]